MSGPPVNFASSTITFANSATSPKRGTRSVPRKWSASPRTPASAASSQPARRARPVLRISLSVGDTCTTPIASATSIQNRLVSQNTHGKG
ncbi:MAG: hypothetical protein ACKPBU_00495 [Alphaproteobacteria bacterium]